MSQDRKLLYLVRHAKSSWDDPSLSDIDRPLSNRGRRNAPDMGRRLQAQGHRPECVIASPARRAQMTARLVIRELGLDAAEIITDPELYFRGTGAMLAALEGVEDGIRSVMMVGHNPTMTHLLNTLCGTRVGNMVTCAIAIVDFGAHPWSEASASGGELVGYDFPKGPGRFTGEHVPRRLTH